jgi:ATP-dependent Lhr-like helicase
VRPVSFGIESAGRWSRLNGHEQIPRDEAVVRYAKVLLARYGVVFNRLLARENVVLPWRELLLAYRRLEARGEIRGGRFVAGVTGEQFALPEAVAQLRNIRRGTQTGKLIAISAVDPLNLTGIVLPGERIPALAGNRILFEDGIPVAVLEAGEVRVLGDRDAERRIVLERALIQKTVSPALRARLGIRGRRPPDFSKRKRGITAQ